MKTQVKPTKKNSPAIHRAHDVTNGPADEYAKPHDMKGRKVGPEAAFTEPEFQKKKNWVPLMGVSITMDDRVETEGIKIRGTGAATKGLYARGPLA
jgi:hypothetical protein